MQETRVLSLCQKDPLENGLATHSNILAWRTLGLRSLAGYSPGGRKESDPTEHSSANVIIIYAVPPPHPLSYRETLKLCSLMYPRINRTVPGTQYVSKSATFCWVNKCDFSTQHPRCFYHPSFFPPSLCPFSNLNLPNTHFLSLWCCGFCYFQAAESHWRKITEACQGDPPQNHIVELICDFNHD